MTRLVFLLHRYLGIALGLVLLVWCVSGIVMMYVQYPELTPADEVGTLETLDLGGCCVMPAGLSEAETASFDGLRVEMLAGRPVLRASRTREQRYWDLASGAPLGNIDAGQASAVAASYAAVAGLEAYSPVGVIERDQWTVYGAYDPKRPLHKFAAGDSAGTEWYVSGTTGEIVQVTTASVRFWNWLGAVPHWLYPTVLRQHTGLWSQVVIWLTILGTFLTVFGVYIGVKQLKTRRSGRYSPYRGVSLWHHYSGLFFGLLTLTWLVSGFFSMNPWGALESRSFVPEHERLRAGELLIDRAWIDGLAALRGRLPQDTVRLEGHVVGGQQFLVAWDRSGGRERVDLPGVAAGDSTYTAGGSSPGLTADTRRELRAVLAAAPALLRPDAEVAEAGWLESADAYYYSHHDIRDFPVYRIVYADGERFYLDALTAEVTYAVDASRRLYRWLHYGLHRGDFALIRERPVWDLVLLVLLAGVTVGSFTGTWIGMRRLRRWMMRGTAGTGMARAGADEVATF